MYAKKKKDETERNIISLEARTFHSEIMHLSPNPKF